MTTTICIRLSGGLGNQMFQYALGRSMADRYGYGLQLDASGFLLRKQGVTPREYALDVFRVRTSVNQKGALYGEFLLRVIKKIPKICRLLGIRFEYNENYDPMVMKERGYRYWIGYWQSYRYFESFSRAIYEDFRPQRRPSKYAIDFVRNLKPERSIMLHVRRGDYVSSSSAYSYHSTLSLEYYREAIDRCNSMITNPIFYVFSDDIKWCREQQIVHSNSVFYVDQNPDRKDWEDLWMMSNCYHQIIANSSFSWWSAWLSDQRHKEISKRLVIAPGNWFKTRKILTGDRFPTHWTTI